VRRLAPLTVVAAVLLAACGGSDEEGTPEACLSGPRAFSDALQNAPGAVRLQGEVLISDCLAPNQSAGDLARLGTTTVELATELNAQARRRPGGAATVQLGYLIGALERGAAETLGVHAELLRRLESAALFSPAGKPPPPPFDQAYERGYAAGRSDG
jgi:hypothetical protein